MEVFIEVHKIIECTIYSIVFVFVLFLFFFTSGGGIEDVLVRLSLTEEITKDANLMHILSVSNIYRHFGNCD